MLNRFLYVQFSPLFSEPSPVNATFVLQGSWSERWNRLFYRPFLELPFPHSGSSCTASILCHWIITWWMPDCQHNHLLMLSTNATSSDPSKLANLLSMHVPLSHSWVRSERNLLLSHRSKKLCSLYLVKALWVSPLPSQNLYYLVSFLFSFILLLHQSCTSECKVLGG